MLFGSARGTGSFSLGGFHEKSRFAVAVGLGSQSTESASPELLGPSLLFRQKAPWIPTQISKTRRFEIPNGQDSVARGLKKWLKSVGSNPGSS